MQIDIWSDVVCPWCYIGKRRLEAALSQFEGQDGVTVVYHSFELDPNAPKQANQTLEQMLSRKYGMPVERARAMQAQVTDLAAKEGLRFDMAAARPENTFDAHRLAHLAASRGKQLDVIERLFRAYFSDGRRVGDHDALVALAKEAGLDEAEARATLADPNAFSDAVREDAKQARAIGIRGVPFYVIDGKYGVSGAQPADTLLAALRQAWAERAPEVAAGEACVDDSCAVPEPPKA